MGIKSLPIFFSNAVDVSVFVKKAFKIKKFYLPL